MKTIKNENVVVFDVDQTLLIWNKDHDKPGQGKIEVQDPYDAFKTIYLKPHHVHCRLLRQYKGRGFTVIVWTKAGYSWAESAVKILNLEKYVDYVMTKPDRHVDDSTKIEDIIGNRLYFEDKT